MASKVDNFGNCTFEQINPNDVLFDPRIQRDQKECSTLRKKIEKEWNINLCELITLNKRKDGIISCVDGQNRVLVARNLNIDALPARVFHMLSFEQESKLFVELNKNRKAVSPVDQFKNRINYKDPSALEIQEILSKYGIVIQKNNSKRKYTSAAVTTFDTLYQNNVLDYVLKVVETCWGGGEDWAKRNFLHSYLLHGLGDFFNNMYMTAGGDKVRPSADTLIEAILMDNNCVPDNILHTAKENSKSAISTGAGFAKPVSAQFMKIYNKKHRGKNRLMFQTKA